MPGSFQSNAGNGVPNVASSMAAARSFGEFAPFEYPYSISGTTRSGSGAALPNCAVTAFRTADKSIAAQVVSDANGLYLFSASPSLQHEVVAYLAGSPDVAGTTVNTLVGT